MLTITLKPDIAEQISYLAEAIEPTTNTDEIVDKALRLYLEQFKREKFKTERNAFEQQLPTLRTQYLNQYVAIHEEQVIDHDLDLRTLHLRVFDQLGHTPVLMKQVTNSSKREMVFRSPRIERD